MSEQLDSSEIHIDTIVSDSYSYSEGNSYSNSGGNSNTHIQNDSHSDGIVSNDSSHRNSYSEINSDDDKYTSHDNSNSNSNSNSNINSNSNRASDRNLSIIHEGFTEDLDESALLDELLANNSNFDEDFVDVTEGSDLLMDKQDRNDLRINSRNGNNGYSYNLEKQLDDNVINNEEELVKEEFVERISSAEELLEEEREVEEEDGPEEGWEYNKRHVFILSSSGKPIFSKYGDEQELVTTFGLIQAVISIVYDSGDCIRCIQAGNRKVVYLLKDNIYLVTISSTEEPEAILTKHLNFMYSQLLLILTAKVQDVLKRNQSADIRQLLGDNGTKVFSSSCRGDYTPTCIAFDAVHSFTCSRDLREDVVSYLKTSVEKSGAALGLFVYRDRPIACILNSQTQLELGTADICLLTHFVANSSSLHSSDHHWVPICMPGFNPNGFIQAYVSDMQVVAAKAVLTKTGGITYVTDDDLLCTDFTLIFLASSADPEVFQVLHKGRNLFEKYLVQYNAVPKIQRALSLQNKSVNKYLQASGCVHFLFKFHPTQMGKSRSLLLGSNFDDAGANQLPTQYIDSSTKFPLSNTELYRRIILEYQKMSLEIRCGSSLAEDTLFPQAPPVYPKKDSHRFGLRAQLEDLQFMKKHTSKNKMNDYSIHKSNSRNQIDETTEAEDNEIDMQKKFESVASATSKLPSSDHALVYTVLYSGHIVVSFATFDSELYVTYPPTFSPMDACNYADYLSKSLRLDAPHLFQINQG